MQQECLYYVGIQIMLFTESIKKQQRNKAEFQQKSPLIPHNNGQKQGNSDQRKLP